MRVKPTFLAHKNGLIEGNLTDFQVTFRLQKGYKLILKAEIWSKMLRISHKYNALKLFTLHYF